MENCCRVFLEPHPGQVGVGWLLLNTSFSKVFLHCWQVYSKIGIEEVHPDFLLSGESSRPDRAGDLGDHVKRDTPGILGRTRNQTTRKTIKKITPSMPDIIHHCGCRTIYRSNGPIQAPEVRNSECRMDYQRRGLQQCFMA